MPDRLPFFDIPSEDLSDDIPINRTPFANQPPLPQEPNPATQREGRKKTVRYQTPVGQCKELISLYEKAEWKLAVLRDDCEVAFEDGSMGQDKKRKMLYDLRQAATTTSNSIVPVLYKMPQETQAHPFFREVMAASERLKKKAVEALEYFDDAILMR